MHIICKFDQANRLGKLYGRQAKPFAVMFRDLSAVKKYAELKEDEEKLVTSAHRPIVLLDKNPSLDDLDDISQGLGNIGIYLPYSGFHYVLFHNPLLHSPINKLSRTYPHAFSQLYEVES